MSEYQNIEIREVEKKGKGVFALRDFIVGEVIFRSERGCLVRRDEITTLSEEEKDHLDVVDENTYEIMPPPACYVNHSCDPNMIEETDDRESVWYAVKPIRAGEEITTDYRIRAFDDWKMQCYCGANNCLGVIEGNFFTMSQELQEKYLSYAPKFIQRLYKERNSTAQKLQE